MLQPSTSFRQVFLRQKVRSHSLCDVQPFMKVRCIELLSLHRFTGKFAVDVDLLVQAEHPWHHRFHDSRIALHGIQAQGTRTIQLWRNTSTTMSQQTDRRPVLPLSLSPSLPSSLSPSPSLPLSRSALRLSQFPISRSVSLFLLSCFL